MKLRLATVCALFLGFLCAEVPAQSVYVTRGENGPVFSDKPQAGAKELTLKPLTVIPAPQGNVPANKAGSPSGGPDARQAERKPPEAVTPYRSLTVVEPADGGSVAGDTSLLEVRLAVDPPLLLAEGHTLDEAVQSLGHVAEGVYSARTVVQRAQAAGVEMPIASAVLALLDGRMSAQAAVRFLLERDPKHESL